MFPQSDGLSLAAYRLHYPETYSPLPPSTRTELMILSFLEQGPFAAASFTGNRLT